MRLFGTRRRAALPLRWTTRRPARAINVIIGDHRSIGERGACAMRRESGGVRDRVHRAATAHRGAAPRQHRSDNGG